MLEKVEIRTGQGETLTLPLRDTSDGFLITDIDGLDPVKATIVSSNIATMDGAQFQSSRREARNIVIKLSLQPTHLTGSPRELRNRLYKYLMPKSEVRLRFFLEYEELPLAIDARVETFESTLFTKDPEVTISLLCFEPDFYHVTPIVVTGSNTSETLINYEGSIESGFRIRMHIPRMIDSLTIFHRRGNEELPTTMDFTEPLVTGDVLKITTVSGSKSAAMVTDGKWHSILYGVSPQSKWLELYPGENYIRVRDGAGGPIPYTVEYSNMFGGL